MRIGIIGTGNIGGMLSKAFATAHPDAHITIYNRTRSKADRVAEGLSNVQVALSAADVANASDTIFLCTKPADGWAVLDDIGPRLESTQTLVTTISSIPLSEIEHMTNASVAKVIPSIVQSVQSGVILVTCGPTIKQDARNRLYQLLTSIASYPYEVTESQVRVCSDLCSCGPAFLSEMLVHWADAAAMTGQISADEAQLLLSNTVIGLANLLKSGKTFAEVITHVAVPGGVTETGILALRQDTPAVFQNLHQATRHHGHGRQPNHAVSESEK
ncbi:pyrroline-5-carboxylate reductase dimerization domain-containing protein [Alicyclobacillus ferrooxydans]|uniref:Pyrroline-5-carboxylate reductase n=1 Tax=Alicyclobacillus ferrooxydans TaxID=471514 RepID=A0A0P9GWE0_9BACL|nr:pyrroline-5-carboxylate reductase dimerization domain-containing protein [Alicyclobacillus ferrooxydans]KPV45608.1 hypothetical protein AN477_01420 [Alicyclobacillus ferrooxydans]